MAKQGQLTEATILEKATVYADELYEAGYADAADVILELVGTVVRLSSPAKTLKVGDEFAIHSDTALMQFQAVITNIQSPVYESPSKPIQRLTGTIDYEVLQVELREYVQD